MQPPQILKPVLGMMCLWILGCGGIVESIKQAASGDDDPSREIAPVAAKADTKPAIRAGALVLMNAAQRPVPLYKTVDIDLGGDLKPRFSGVLKRMPVGTVGQLLMAHETAEWTYAVEAKFTDGSKGVVDVKHIGLIYRVKGVRSDDTLNIRAGRSHKRTKVGEIPPEGPVFVAGEHAMDMAGCDGQMSKKDKWWRVRTLEGIEGYVNCNYLGHF